MLRGVCCRRRQQHITHVANGAVGHHLLHILLGNGRQGTVENADHRPSRHPGGEGHPGVGEQPQAEPHQPVGAQLQQHPRPAAPKWEWRPPRGHRAARCGRGTGEFFDCQSRRGAQSTGSPVAPEAMSLPGCCRSSKLGVYPIARPVPGKPLKISTPDRAV